MKTISKILSIVLALTLVLGLAVMASAASESMDIKATTGTLAGDELSISWTGTDFTFKVEKDQSTSAIRVSDATHFRAYKSSKTVITALNSKVFSKIIITAESNDYANVVVESVTAAGGATAVADTKVVTITLNAPAASYEFSATAQYRLNKVEVSFGACSHEYTDCDDTTCNLCSEPREALEHKYDGCDDTACNTCNKPRTALAHAYTQNPYGCDNCDYVKYPTETTLTLDVAIKLGEGHAHNKYSATEFAVTGVIKEVYEGTYGNMYLEDAAGNVFTIYGTYDTEGTRYDKMTVKPVKGDTVTVKGVIGQYNGKAQIKNGTITNHVPVPVTCEHTTVENYVCTACERAVPPAADTKLTLAEAIKLGAAVGNSSYTDGKYYVTGVITKVENAEYGNLTIKDADGNTYLIYGSYSKDGAAKYSELTDKPNEGDTITVYGVVGNYKGDAQMKNGWITEHVEGTPSDLPVTGDSAMIAPLAVLMVLSAAGLVVLTTGKKKFF